MTLLLASPRLHSGPPEPHVVIHPLVVVPYCSPFKTAAAAAGEEQPQTAAANSAPQPAEDAAGQLRRLQLAQRQLWAEEGVRPGARPDRGSCQDAANAEQPTIHQSSLGRSDGSLVADPSGGVSPPAASAVEASQQGRPAADPGELPSEPHLATSSGTQAAAQPAQSPTASSGSSLVVADHGGGVRSQPVGRELFISGSYFNHRQAA